MLKRLFKFTVLNLLLVSYSFGQPFSPTSIRLIQQQVTSNDTRLVLVEGLAQTNQTDLANTTSLTNFIFNSIDTGNNGEVSWLSNSTDNVQAYFTVNTNEIDISGKVDTATLISSNVGLQADIDARVLTTAFNSTNSGFQTQIDAKADSNLVWSTFINKDGSIAMAAALNIGSNDIVNVVNITFTNGQANGPRSIFFDQDNDTLSYINTDTNIITQLGQEGHILARSTNGAAILNGEVSYAIGHLNDGRLLIDRAAADSTDDEIIGIATANFSGQDGKITSWGYVRSLDTSSWTNDFEKLYPSTTDGQMTNVPPNPWSPIIAYVTRVHPTEGEIYVHTHEKIIDSKMRVDYVPSNYSVTGTTNLTGHLNAIDAALGPWSVQTLTINSYGTSANDLLRINASAGIATVTLHSAATSGDVVRIKKIDNVNNVIIEVQPSDNIDSQTQFIISQQWEAYEFVSDGTTNWSVW